MGITVQSSKLRSQITNLEARLNPIGIDGYVTWLAGGAHSYLQSQSRKRFKAYAKGSSEWPALAPATESWRESLHYGAASPINVRTGDLLELMVGENSTIAPVGGSMILLYPGSAQGKGNRPIKIAQAQGTLRQNNGQMSTPRPVITLEPEDFAALLASFVQFLRSPSKGKGGH
ncbi:hypothetical protein SEA_TROGGLEHUMPER_38 [Rhodococcus phage Trogglehumper]|uniref:Uncharacterized protein n=1 Tax=Rhodococcus phage Trogglehumper TaxID=3038381 RepID=A0AAF0K1K0_9CAUD|nr:hypothetical protein SEA_TROGGLEHUMPER_38 [Rhodococcus phage Trogglehumper]